MHIIRQKKTPHLITNRTPAALGTSALCQKRPTPGRFYQSPHSGSTAREAGASYGGWLKTPPWWCAVRKRTKRPRNTRVTREGEPARDNPKAENAAGVRGDVIDPPRIVTSDQAPGTRLRLSGCATARVGTWSVARRAAWQYRGTLFAR